jgi:histidyl-tRNA synthetase
VALPEEDARPVSDEVAQRLRARGIACEVAPAPQKYGKQIRYAERRGIPFVWFPGVEGKPHEVKDIRSGDQVEADPDGWSPPEADLTPNVISTSSITDTQGAAR